jgi:hypothetical protein
MEETIQELMAEKYVAEIERLRKLMDMAFANGAASTSLPEDKVVFPLLVSCRDITEEVLFAVKDGFGRAAFRATRTMYECVVIARHLNLHPEKTSDFLDIFHAEWARVYQDLPDARRVGDMDQSIAAHVPKYAQGRRVGMNELDWSGTHVHEMAKDAGRLADLHSLAYTLASAYIHPGAMFYLSTLSLSGQDEGVVKISEKAQDVESKYALRIAHDLLLNAVDLRLKHAPSATLKAQVRSMRS